MRMQCLDCNMPLLLLLLPYQGPSWALDQSTRSNEDRVSEDETVQSSTGC